MPGGKRRRQGEKPGIGERFQETTKYAPDTLAGHALDWAARPEQEKEYGEHLGRVGLADPPLSLSTVSLWELLARRRSRRRFEGEAVLPRAFLSALLWGTQGVTGGSAGGHLSLMIGGDSDSGQIDAEDPIMRVSNRVAAVVAYYPPVDIRPMAGRGSERFPALNFDREGAAAISPITNLVVSILFSDSGSSSH